MQDLIYIRDSQVELWGNFRHSLEADEIPILTRQSSEFNRSTPPPVSTAVIFLSLVSHQSDIVVNFLLQIDMLRFVHRVLTIISSICHLSCLVDRRRSAWILLKESVAITVSSSICNLRYERTSEARRSTCCLDLISSSSIHLAALKCSD